MEDHEERVSKKVCLEIPSAVCKGTRKLHGREMARPDPSYHVETAMSNRRMTHRSDQDMAYSRILLFR